MFAIVHELSAAPEAGQLPLQTNLRFVARSLTGPLMVDVLYRIVDIPDDLKIAIASASAPEGVIIPEGPKRFRQAGVGFTGLFKSVKVLVNFVEGPGTADPKIPVIQASLVLPGGDISASIEQTSTTVRIQ